MDDYSITSLSESKNEWCARLVNTLTPAMIVGLKSIFNEAWNVCLENDEEDKYLMTFQTFLSRVPKWNAQMISNERKRIEDSINEIYNTFKKKVIDGRKGLDDINELDNIAMGRVWTGNKAKENLLVDKTGGINDAILLAAKDAGIDDLNNINIVEYPKKDIAENIRSIINEVSADKNILINQLPKEIKDEYDHLININKMSKDGAIMIAPYKIEIK